MIVLLKLFRIFRDRIPPVAPPPSVGPARTSRTGIAFPIFEDPRTVTALFDPAFMDLANQAVLAVKEFAAPR